MTALATLTAIGTQIAVGGGLFYGVVKFFDLVGDRLNEDTRLEIAVWLLDAKAEPHLNKWIGTVLAIFFSVCGAEDSVIPTADAILVRRTRAALLMGFTCWIPCTLPVVYDLYRVNTAVVCPYTMVALLTAVVLCSTVAFVSLGYCNVLRHRVAVKGLVLPVVAGILIIGFIVPVIAFRIVMYGHFVTGIANTETVAPCLARWWLSALVSVGVVSAWLGVSTAAGLLLKTVCRFDRAFRWFNRRFDIEKKPLQSIGLVAGAIVACVYWAAVLVMRFV